MGHAKYVGRVGALAVTLGVGLAMASTPAIAYATPSDSSSSTSDSSSTKKSSSSTSTSSSTTKGSAGDDATSTDGSDDTDSSASDVKSPSGSADRSTVETDVDADDDTGDDGDDAEEADAAEDPTGDVDDETPPATGDEETPPADAASENDDVTVKGSPSGYGLHASIPSDAAGKVESSVTAVVGQSNRPRLQTSNTDAVADASVDDSSAASADAVTTFVTTFSARTARAAVAPTAPQQQPTIVSVVSDLVAAVLQPFMSPGTGSPILPSLLLGLLSAVRNEIERALFRSTTNAAPQYTVTQIDPTPNSVPADPTPNVLVIGVDGTNLSRILADDENDNFFALMDDGTTAASSIVGHTTISNPSWSAILTGVWSERTGVINNVFTPSTYDKWPTVFNQLEADNSDIETTAIADWDVINAIAGAGSIPVDENIYIPQIEGDTDWSQTDDAVGDATVDAIEDTPVGVPTFLFSYFVGVDENGHMHGGASPEYAAAIRNVDENLGEILAAVEAWETAHPDEGEWTIIVVTDHGHQPQQGFGHGFQTPDETATFVIASGPDFNDGWVNPDYEIVDTTPTVLTLFGAPVPENLDGVSLTTLGGSDELPDDLHQALEDMIAENHSPDIVTNVALSLRTIFATIPYYVWTLTNDGTLPGPVGTVLYVATNIPAQIVALLTGATGASIFPLLPPGPPSWPGQEATTDTAILACGGGELGSAADVCDAASVA